MNALRTTSRWLAATGALLAAVAAALAAAGSHALAAVLSPAELASFNTAVAFQFVNALGLIAMAWANEVLPASRLARVAGWSLLAGVLAFCGSIYAARLGLVDRPALAPAGGSAVIVAWLLLAAAFVTAPRR